MITSVFSPQAQQVLTNAENSAGQPGGPFPSPADWRDQVIYFLMVDRFNNPDVEPVHSPYGDPTFGLYQGGNFAGVQQQLNYIKRLGAGAIWLSPVLKNLPWDGGSYHGYGIHDFCSAEPKFAANPQNADAELRALVDAAHSAGLYVIFDIVLNHAGNVFTYDAGDEPPFSSATLPIQWRDSSGIAVATATNVASIQSPSTDAIIWPSELQKNASFRRQGEPSSSGPDTIGDFDTLRQLMTSSPDVQRTLIRVFQYVVARFDVDGFRIDTLRYLPSAFAQTFGNSMREYALTLGKKNFFTFGEILDPDPEADFINFIGRTTIGDNMNSPVGVDAALDYPLYNSLVPAAKGSAPPTSMVTMYNRRKDLDQNFLSSHGDASRYFVTFLDNHDNQQRFHWVQPGNPTQYDDQLTMAIACLYTLPGIPCVYYGTEQGLHGFGSDPAVREALWGLVPGFPQNASFYPEMQKIVAVRQSQPSLRYGRFYFRPISGDHIHFGISAFPNGILAWSRIINDQEVLVVANTNTTQPAPPVDVILEITLSTPGQPVGILYSNKSAPANPGPVTQFTNVIVAEPDGTTGTGPVNTTRVTLQPMEVQILRVQL
jgi:glycosidase